jgi:hypothetical protein
MNSVGINTSVYANVVAPFSPVGKQAVGLENAEAKEEVLPPVEEPATNQASADQKSESKQPGLQDERDQRLQEREAKQQQQQQLQQDQQQIRELSARDREVRAHEQAHASVGGKYAGAASFTFARGPDGVSYAVGGEVPIVIPALGDDPALTLAAAEQVKRAALAPADPSAQDRSVASAASRLAVDARANIAQRQAEEQAQASAEAKQARREEQLLEEQKDKELQEEQQALETKEQELAELRQLSRRGGRLGERLLTLDNVQSDQNIGSLIDQRA